MTLIALHLKAVRSAILQTSWGRSLTRELEIRTGGLLSIENVWGGIELVLLVCVLCGFGGTIITSLVGFVYPAYKTIRAMETDGKEDEDDTEWVMYWLVFAGLGVLEAFRGYITYWIPFYWVLKMLFLLWCFAFKGSNVLEGVVVPLIRGSVAREVHANEVFVALDK